MEIQIKNITKKYNDFTAVDNISLSVKEGELLALLGSSGCGKTTLLRMIAGLIPVDEGKILLGEKDITFWSPQKRNTAMVFQNYALFPHLTVFENVAYGLRVRKVDKKEIKYRVDSILEKVELNGLGNRKIQELSGGQRQRAALARALVIEPDVLLFDEPLSNLDESLRITMRKEIRKLQKELGITSIYVTHDQNEAMALADKIAVMDKGVICQVGSPEEIFYYPNNYITAEFMGQPNIYRVPVENKNDSSYIDLFGEKLIIDTSKDEIVVVLRPEEIEMGEEGISGTVIDVEVIASVKRYHIDVRGENIYIDILNKLGEGNYKKGDKIFLQIPKEAIYIIE